MSKSSLTIDANHPKRSSVFQTNSSTSITKDNVRAASKIDNKKDSLVMVPPLSSSISPQPSKTYAMLGQLHRLEWELDETLGPFAFHSYQPPRMMYNSIEVNCYQRNEKLKPSKNYLRSMRRRIVEASIAAPNVFKKSDVPLLHEWPKDGIQFQPLSESEAQELILQEWTSAQKVALLQARFNSHRQQSQRPTVTRSANGVVYVHVPPPPLPH